jgi:hypothetical protein
MKVIASLLLIHFVASMPMFAQPAASGKLADVDKVATTAATYSSLLPATNTSIWVGLHGIFTVPPMRKALLEIRTPGQDPIRCVAAEGEKVAGLELIAIREVGQKVVVYYNGATNELTLGPLADAGTASEIEREKDVSHQEYHKRRARVEREKLLARELIDEMVQERIQAKFAEHDALESGASQSDSPKQNLE